MAGVPSRSLRGLLTTEERAAPLRGLFAAARPVLSGLMLPGDVYAGRVDPRSDEAIKRAFDLASSVSLGAGAIPTRANELRMGIAAPKRLYHGTRGHNGTFDDTRPVFLAQEKRAAETYAKHRMKAGSSSVYKIGADIKNAATDNEIIAAAKETGLFTNDIDTVLMAQFVDPVVDPRAAQVIATLKKKGFDGARFDDFDMEDREITTWAAFHPSKQLKID